jgi:hypothetical protein
MPSTSGLVQIVVALLMGGALTGVITTIANRKKVGADTSQVFVGTAEELVGIVRAELKRVVEDLVTERLRAEALEEGRRGWFKRADLHSAWDRRAMERCPDLGEPPGLYPPPDGE